MSKFISLCFCIALLLTGPLPLWTGERGGGWCGAGSGAGPGGGGRPGGSPRPPRPPLRRSPAARQDSPHQSSLAQGNRKAELACNKTTYHLPKYLEKYGIEDFLQIVFRSVLTLKKIYRKMVTRKSSHPLEERDKTKVLQLVSTNSIFALCPIPGIQNK